MTNARHHDVQLAVRVPRSLLRELDDLIPGLHRTRAEAVRAAMESYLYRLSCERDAGRYEATPLGDQELALVDDANSWAATPPW